MFGHVIAFVLAGFVAGVGQYVRCLLRVDLGGWVAGAAQRCPGMFRFEGRCPQPHCGVGFPMLRPGGFVQGAPRVGRRCM